MSAGIMTMAWGMAFSLGCALGSSSAWAGASSARDAKLDAMLQKEAQDYVDNFVRAHPEQGSVRITVRSWADLEAAVVYADFGPGALTDVDVSNERLEQELGSTLLHYARNSGMPRETEFRALYQGQPYNFYFPYVPATWAPGLSRLKRGSVGLAAVSASPDLYSSSSVAGALIGDAEFDALLTEQAQQSADRIEPMAGQVSQTRVRFGADIDKGIARFFLESATGWSPSSLP